MPSQRRHNPEKRAWRGKSYRKGGERVRSLREKEIDSKTKLEYNNLMDNTVTIKVRVVIGNQDFEWTCHGLNADNGKENPIMVTLQAGHGLGQDFVPFVVKTPCLRDGLVKDVHTEHCCKNHGCKYDDPYCTVTSGLRPQSFPCDCCGE